MSNFYRYLIAADSVGYFFLQELKGQYYSFAHRGMGNTSIPVSNDRSVASKTSIGIIIGPYVKLFEIAQRLGYKSAGAFARNFIEQFIIRLTAFIQANREKSIQEAYRLI